MGNSPSHTYRPDIDGLRALAVLAVVIYHAFPSVLRGGFVGVDIFFVISGYLITGILWRELDAQRFSLLHFYQRRILRIFPSLILVLATTLAFGVGLLLADELAQLGRHIAAGSVFASNWLLWSESHYFDTSAQTKPLLHLWSLAIEEQFYMVWPLLLLLFKRIPKWSVRLLALRRQGGDVPRAVAQLIAACALLDAAAVAVAGAAWPWVAACIVAYVLCRLFQKFIPGT